MRTEEQIVSAALAHRLTWTEAWREMVCGPIPWEDLRWTCPETDLMERIAAADLSPNDAWYSLHPPPAWWHDARPSEVGAFRLSPHQPGDGSAVTLLSDAELTRQLQQVRARSPHLATAWLRRYAAILVAEHRSRRAGHEENRE